MKKYFLIVITFFMFSCSDTDHVCEIQSNGFIDGIDGQVMMGSQSAVEVFKEMDKAWAALDYDKLKTFVADGAVMKFADGEVANGPDEFVEQIKREVVEIEEKGNDFKWNTDYAFSLAVTTGEGDWVNAQFTSTHTNPDSELEAEVFYEFYHIIDGKVQEWNQFKRTELK
ncbi:MAG: nuclear transport factor 2 family protein [Bacteroidota bacterium]|nr:nuclear transport factor 2 family protein [Bacteroidota bacterium]